MKKLAALALTLIMSIGVSNAQKIKAIKGNFAPLKGEKDVHVEYTYDELMVGKLTESEYIEKKTREYNEKEPGKGDKFKAAWETDHKNRFQPKFEELINKAAPNFKFGSFPNANYKLVINTTFIDPGWNVGVSKKPAFMDCEIKLIDAEGKVLAEWTVEKAPGSQFGGYDYDSGTRIAECYAITGKRLGGMVMKDTKK